jgi:hypothetical protein
MEQPWSKGFYEQICEVVKETVINNVIDYIYEVMRNEIYMTVYNEYSPTQYERRYDSNGGLADKTQFNYKLDVSSNGFTINIFNDAKANGDNNGDYLDEIIVEGDKYTWEKSKIYEMQPFPRDFYQATLEELIDSGVLFNIVKTKLKDKGINII